MPTLTKAPSPKEFANAWTRGFAAAVRSAAGTDGRLSANEAENIKDKGPVLSQYADNAINYLDRTGQKSVSVNKLIGKGHNYAAAVADRSAGDNNRLSLVEARNLPEDIRGDFFALRGKEDPGAAQATTLKGAALVSALDKAAETPDGYAVNYISEGDYPVLGIHAANPENLPVNGETAMKLFEDELSDGVFEDMDVFFDELTSETSSPAESKAWLAELATEDPDLDDYYKEQSDGFSRIKSVLEDNLTDLRVIKVGPKDDDGTLAVDSGTYAYLIVGKDQAGDLAGVYFGSAET